MTQIDTEPLNPTFGVEVKGRDLMEVAAENQFPEIRALFEEHSAHLFQGQDLAPEKHVERAGLFGPIEDREADERKPGETFRNPEVSNVMEDGTTSEEMDLKTLNLKSNFLWYSDSIFLPVPSLTNILVARIVTTEGGGTQLASNRAAWAERPDALNTRIEGRGIWHHYSHSRKKISEELAKLPMFTKWPDQHWKAVWTNPVNGREALHLASHAIAVDCYSEAEGEALPAELTAFCTQPRCVYAHRWELGDVLLRDQRAVMHRGTPWPYDKPRKLSSICSSVRESDGLAAMRVEALPA